MYKINNKQECYLSYNFTITKCIHIICYHVQTHTHACICQTEKAMNKINNLIKMTNNDTIIQYIKMSYQ